MVELKKLQQELQLQLEEEEYGQAQLREQSFEIIYAKTNSTCKSITEFKAHICIQKVCFMLTSDEDLDHHEGGKRARSQ